MTINVENIRFKFIEKYQNNDFVVDKTGSKVVEIVGANFEADENFIFGKPNDDYIKREIDWYNSQSLNVYDIEPPVPQIWKDVSSKNGLINSNYGWCAYSGDNYLQYDNVVNELKTNPDSRRAIMIYNRPSMHNEYNLDGMSDFMCTNAVQYLIRDGVLNVVVQMRSNDAWAGYRNDFAWQDHVAKNIQEELNISDRKIIWNVGSMHVYEKQFWMIDCWFKFEKCLSKKEYEEMISQ